MMALPALIIGGFKFGYGNYVEEGLVLFTRQEIFSEIIVCYLVVSVVLVAYVSYSLFISVLIPNPGYAIGLCVGVALMMDFVRVRMNISSFIFQSYIETPFELAKGIAEGFKGTWRPDVYFCILVPLAWAIIFFTLALYLFARKDYKS